MVNHKIAPRGIRNNNPLNIRIGNVWLGEVQCPTDPDFEQFVTMAYGIRAAFVLLRRYINHYHRTTIPAVIAAWAPASENNVTAYCQTIYKLTGYAAGTQLIYEDDAQMVSLVDAMIVHECGEHVSLDAIKRGYKMA